MIESEEGADFVSAFKEKFAGDPSRTKARANAERRAGMTPKQRARRGVPKAQKNFRASKETLAQLKALVARTGLTETDVIALAIDALAKSRLQEKA